MLPALLYALLFMIIIGRWRFMQVAGINSWWLQVAFGLKLIAGVALWYIYTYHYNAAEESDAHRYYNDAMVIRQQLDENPEVFYSLMMGCDNDSPQYQAVYDQLVGWYSGYRYGLTNDCRTIIRLHVLLSFASFGSYHVHWMFMAFISFIGLAALFRAFESLFESRKKWLFAACFLLPSVVFWSAGLLKEGPTILGLGFLLLGISRWYADHKRWQPYVQIVLSMALLTAVKEYVLFAMLPAMAFVLLIKLTGQRLVLVKFMVTQAMCFIVAQQAQHFFVGGDFLYVLNKKRVDFENTSLIRQANSSVYVPETNSVSAFAIHYPEAFALSYLRPFLWESRSWMYALFALENLVYAMLIGLAMLFFRKPPPIHWVLLLTALSFVLVLASIIGNCVPVLGSIVRYRIVALPLLVIICIACINWDKAKHTFQKLK